MPTCNSFRVLVGLEIHVQLATEQDVHLGRQRCEHFGAPPNTLVDEQVLGLPGMLPVTNSAG